MFPLKDENPTELIPFVAFLLIAANLLVWFFVQGAGMDDRLVESVCLYGAVPAQLTGAIDAGTVVPLGDGIGCRVGAYGYLSVLTSMFMHGGWMHLIGNMWFLWVFGNNIEDSMGHLRFIVFYLLTGAAAAGAHVLVSSDSAIPMVGASGAISGVMGAYIVLYPKVRVHTLIIFVFFIRVLTLPAVAVLGLWFALQLLSGAASYGAPGGGVAYGAHIGGFVAGVVLVKLFERPKLVQAKREHRVLTLEELPRRERW